MISTVSSIYLVFSLVFTPFCGPEPQESSSAQDRYVVVTHVEQSDPYYQSAELLAKHRSAAIAPFDPADLSGLEARLKKLKPRFVAVVAKPSIIETNFIRKLLMLSTRIDEDPFCDFAWGYITGATAEEALNFVKNIQRAEKEGLPKRFLNSSVSYKCRAEKGKGPVWLMKEGYDVSRISFGCKEERQVIKTFVKEHLPDLQGQGLIQMTGCGDPERIWLFPDERNFDDTKHWKYNPEKVGQNPGDEMFWIDAHDINKLNLYPAVLTTGTCHCGSVEKVFVESDIVSTFGTSDTLQVYTMPLEKSLGLAYIRCGVTAAILPVGPNHGWRTLVEAYRIFQTGAPLGEVVRSCYNELVLAYNGPITLGLYDPAANQDADHDLDQIMRGGAANRVLYGDPAFAPFKKMDINNLEVTGPSPQGDGSLLVTCRILFPYHARDLRSAEIADQFTSFKSRFFFTAPLSMEQASNGLKWVRLEGEEFPETEYDTRWAVEHTPEGLLLHVMVLSKKSCSDCPLWSREGRVVRFRIEPARKGEKGLWISPHRTLPVTASVLNDMWAYQWNNKELQQIFRSIESIWGCHAKDVGGLRFEFHENARDAATKKVSLKLDSEPLKNGLLRLFESMELTFTYDKTRNVLVVSRKG